MRRIVLVSCVAIGSTVPSESSLISFLIVLFLTLTTLFLTTSVVGFDESSPCPFLEGPDFPP